MLYDFASGRVRAKAVEFSVAHHCNMRCLGCSHLSPFQGKRFPSLERFASVVGKLSRVLRVSEFRLLGGEPLLNPEIDSFLGVANASGIAEKVTVITNGLLLPSMSPAFWEKVDSVVVTLYPDTRNQVQSILERVAPMAKESHAELSLRSKSYFRATVLWDAFDTVFAA